ncbi:uncharacterized protein LOC126996350 [Eriocheir sinensis]|uniref:uncharacterized protein LOC126996350 n=1 Tax=Eriocheir sinensis TaxID=95602 RepID=UPI0021CAB043|nr:uncharacterized protein LOC126996350 [Eriocheir sinensis]
MCHSTRRITMQPYGKEFKNFFANSDSPLFQKLASLIDFVPSLVEGQRQAVERKRVWMPRAPYVCLASQAHLENRRSQHYNIAKLFTRPDGSKLLYIGHESIMPGRSGWPMPHDAPYTATINLHLMAVVEVQWNVTCYFSTLKLPMKIPTQPLRKSLKFTFLTQAGLYEKWARDLLFKVQVESKKKQKQQQEAMMVEPPKKSLGFSIWHLQGAFIVLVLGFGISSLVFAVEFLGMPRCILKYLPYKFNEHNDNITQSVFSHAFD